MFEFEIGLPDSYQGIVVQVERQKIFHLHLLFRYVTFKDGIWASVCISSLGPINIRCETHMKNGSK